MEFIASVIKGGWDTPKPAWRAILLGLKPSRILVNYPIWREVLIGEAVTNLCKLAYQCFPMVLSCLGSNPIRSSFGYFWLVTEGDSKDQMGPISGLGMMGHSGQDH